MQRGLGTCSGTLQLLRPLLSGSSGAEGSGSLPLPGQFFLSIRGLASGMCGRAGDVDLFILVSSFFLPIIGGILAILVIIFLLSFFLFLSGSWLLPLCWLFPLWGGLGFLPFTKFIRGQVDEMRADIGVRMNVS